MEDLIQPQIQYNCKLALPEGLKDLMSDITREVLRARPRNLCKFIADYLSALLVTRDHLSIAAYIVDDVCDCSCGPELERELSDIGLRESEVMKAKDIIVNYFEKPSVNEGSLMLKLMEETTIKPNLMPAVKCAIRKAYLRRQAYTTTLYESSSDSEKDEVVCAAKHTLKLYRKTAPVDHMYEQMALKILNAYRAYDVRRRCVPKGHTIEVENTNAADRSATPTVSALRINSYDIAYPKMIYPGDTPSEVSLPEDVELAISSSISKKRIRTISSTCLAGSFMTLPSQKPYSPHEREVLSDLEEIPEKEHAYIDYTAENPHISLVIDDKQFFKRDSAKKISFNDDLLGTRDKLSVEASHHSENDVDASKNVSSVDTDQDSLCCRDVIEFEHVLNQSDDQSDDERDICDRDMGNYNDPNYSRSLEAIELMQIDFQDL